MQVKQYKVQLKEGICTDIFDSPQAAMKKFGSNLARLIEYESKVKKELKVPTDIALLISARSDADLEVSVSCGYAVMYNCPNKTKLYEGMPYLEVSENSVLEGTVIRLESYSKSLHHHWKGPGYRPDKEWKWAIYHKNSKIIPREVAEKKYNNSLNGTQGGISYIKY
jgi:hypothetical protein